SVFTESRRDDLSELPSQPVVTIMGEILKDWIKNQVGLELDFNNDTDPGKFRRSMSNGVLIGEILRKCSVISDEQYISLRNTLKNKSSVKNMQHIHKWLREIGLNTDFQDLLAIVEEQPGAAIRFLYRLYMWLESPRGVKVFRSQTSTTHSGPRPTVTKHGVCGGRGSNVSRISHSKMDFKSKELLAEINPEFVEEDSNQNNYYDVSLQPPVLLNVKPFSGDNIHERIDNDVLYYDPQRRRKPQQGIEESNCNDKPQDGCSPCLNHDKKKGREALELKIAEEIQISMDEMKSFNETIQHSLERQLPSVKIYEDGTGNWQDYKRSLLTMKKKLQDEQTLANERVDASISSFKFQASVIERSNLSQQISSQTHGLPTQKQNLQFTGSMEGIKSSFMGNQIFIGNQAPKSELKIPDCQASNAVSFINQKELLHRCLSQKDVEFSTCVENEIYLAQKAVFTKNIASDVIVILNGILDLAMRIATYREAVKVDPPGPLVEEWKEEIYSVEATQEEIEAGSVMTILDDLRVRAYIFREADWKVEEPVPHTDFIENEILKKIVSHVLEYIYPDSSPGPTGPLPQLTGIVAVTGVNFHWKPVLVREALQDISEPNSIHLLDAAVIVPEAIKAYATAVAKSANRYLMNGDESLFSYAGEVEEEELNPLWRDPSQDHPHEQDIDADEETEPSDHEPYSPNWSTNSQPQRKKSKKTQTPSKKKSKSRSHKSVNTTNRRNPGIIDLAEPALENIETVPPSPSPQLLPDDAVVTVKAVEEALEQRKDIKNLPEFNERFPTEEPSGPFQIYGRHSLTQMSVVNASAEKEVQFLFSPQDQPETWPELVKLGRLAWDHILAGYPVSDALVAKILTERIRHYPANSFVVILNFPHTLCQSIHLEDSINENNLPRLPCYHYADIIIDEFKELPQDQVGPYLTLAGHHMTRTSKYESFLFKYHTKSLSDSFQSFLDAVVIADINPDQIRDPVVLNNLEVAQQRMINHPKKSINEKLDALSHLSYLQLKRFYTDQGLACMLELGTSAAPYYVALKELLQQLIVEKNGQKRRFLEFLGEAEFLRREEYSMEADNPENTPETEMVPPQRLSIKESIETKETNQSIKANESSSVHTKKKSKGKDKKKSGQGKNGKSKETKKSKSSKSTKAKGDTKNDNVNVKLQKPNEDPVFKEEEAEIVAPPIEIPALLGQVPSIFYNISMDDFTVLGNFWKNLEDRYVRGVRNALHEIRCHHDRVNTAINHVRAKLAEFLVRPEKGPSLLVQFQEKFNQASLCIRRNHEIKTELRNRVGELQERLSAICDERHDEAILKVSSISNDQPCLDGEIEILTNLFITLIQLEADHYCDVIQFINKFYSMSGLLRPENLPSCDILHVELISRSRFSSTQFLDGEEDDEEDILLEVITEKLSAAGLLPGLEEPETSSMRVQQSSKDSNKDFFPSSILSRSNNKKKRSQIRHVSIAANKLKSKNLLVTNKNVPQPSVETVNSLESNPKQVIAKENPDAAPPANRVLEGYFGSDECKDDEVQNSFMDNVLTNHEISSLFFQSIFTRASHKINKVEKFTIDYVKNNVSATSLISLTVPFEGAINEETPSKMISDSLQKDLAKSTNVEDTSGPDLSSKTINKRNKSKGEDGKSKNKRNSKESGSEVEKDNNNSKKKKTNKKQKNKVSSKEGVEAHATNETNLADDKINSPKIEPEPELNSPHHLPHTISNKENAMKRIAEWKKVIKLEGKRVKLQLAAIQAKATQELNQLKERFLEIIFSGEYDTATAYKTDIHNVRAVCDMLRSAIETGAPVGMDSIQEKIEKAMWLLGDDWDDESSGWTQASHQGFYGQSVSYLGSCETSHNHLMAIPTALGFFQSVAIFLGVVCFFLILRERNNDEAWNKCASTLNVNHCPTQTANNSYECRIARHQMDSFVRSHVQEIRRSNEKQIYAMYLVASGVVAVMPSQHFGE
ncbi:unnamed protein product, partial [Allacma fusca]